MAKDLDYVYHQSRPFIYRLSKIRIGSHCQKWQIFTKLRHTQEEGKILQNIIKSLFNTALADSLQDLFKRLIKGFLLLGDLEDRIKDDIIVVANGIEVSLHDQSIGFGEDRVLDLGSALTSYFEDLQDQESIVCGIAHQIDEVLERFLHFAHCKRESNNNNRNSLIEQGILDDFKSIKRHFVLFNMIQSSQSHHLQILLDSFNQSVEVYLKHLQIFLQFLQDIIDFDIAADNKLVPFRWTRITINHNLNSLYRLLLLGLGFKL